ncbi:hypothetical protein HUU62_08925 [Rhodoferax sp. 4810]|uniref:PA14 domain-containing protein n=1 Tax=Thiospirillum jenense TaxID=1653858 RepID=A0A839HHR5_9GAMM|nr:PilC/PilY family type IV pilus protein [Thiospirillum jenense]MBB1074533.1 hypothetical protein [Rhodoferax jenense]MBB1126507.1 hypothetical protein [Thiospirillum jenense]
MSLHNQPNQRIAKFYAFLFSFMLTCGMSNVMAMFAEPTPSVEPLSQAPLFGGGGISAPPLTMLIMGRDHTLYYEAYNDASDLSGDNVLDIGYKPNMTDAEGNQVDYFGYFDSHLCYTHDGSKFVPSGATATKKCSGAWSGDFLNYLTTSRIDALRKVLYGGKRSTDDENETILERSYIPQDAHSWGKEYKSIAHDGYNISQYAPLSIPADGTRHLFANTTLAVDGGNKLPLLRVLNDSRFRIWEWVAIERPVAGTNCVSGGCTTSAGGDTASHPANSSAFQAMVDNWATDAQRCGSGEITNGQINTIGSNNNPFTTIAGCTHDYYLTIITGRINAATAGDYEFATNGDDAVEVLIDGQVVTGWYGGHGDKTDASIETRATNTGSKVTKTLTSGWHSVEFRHEEVTGGDNWQLLWKPPSGVWAIVPAANLRGPDGSDDSKPIITTYKTKRTYPASAMTDYVVRVKVCDASYLDENCKAYGSSHKPIGLLQDYGETDRMLFGLISGSYTHPYNMQGGILRKNIESFANEVDPDTGIFLEDVLGIVNTIDRFRIVDFKMGTDYKYNDGWLATKAMVESTAKFPDWGNPIGEMMYESLRYFSGKTAATSSFLPSSISNNKETVTLHDYTGDSTMTLPAPAWVDPYSQNDALYCSPGAQLVISDVNPSYDSDSVPGSAFGSISGDISGLNAASEANAIWGAEHGGSGYHFIGQVGNLYDGAPTAKQVSGLGDIRGLSPSEPTKQGSYYAAGVARFGYQEDLRSDIQDKQDINTFSVALASPLPKIVIPVDNKLVTLVPFAKSVGGMSINPAKGQFQPTNTIVDFFVETFANTDPNGSDADSTVNEGRPFVKFRINFEDVEQGADHDMDAIIVYELRVNSDNTLTVTLTSEYAAGSIMHHLGYVISGTDTDGVYLEVRDKDTSESNDPDYFLDTPVGVLASGCNSNTPPSACTINNTDTPLPLFATRTFTASNNANVATVLESPLWYAAKYGSEGNARLAQGEKSPNYFLVTNAGKLKEQIEEAFARIIMLGEFSMASVATSSTRATTDTAIYQAIFDSNDWSGDLEEFSLNNSGEWAPGWEAATELNDETGRHLFTWKKETDESGNITTATGIDLAWDDLTTAQQGILDNDQTRLNWLLGDDSLENDDAESPNGYRARTTVLGDIVNSNPLYVGKAEDAGYTYLPTGVAGRDSYATFISGTANRTPVLYVGANDGMLHAFNAATGAEQFAYMPQGVWDEGRVNSLVDKTYAHRYFVDGTPAIGEAYLGSWKSVLVSSLGAGGKGVFALDVTNPAEFNASKVLWEFKDENMGYMVNQMTSSPVIGRMKNGEWAAIFGNGYNSGTGAWLYIVKLNGDPTDPADMLIKKIQVSDDSTNGLSAVTLIRDRYYTVVGAYAGDLKGNLWKFDLTGTSPGGWGIASNGGPLFTATDSTDVAQPITGPLEVGYHPDNGYIVYFGTGQYMRNTDVGNQAVQSIYGIWDNASLQDGGLPDNSSWHGGSAIASRSELLQQTIDYETTADNDPDSLTWRVLSDHAIDWADKRGWFIDLISPENDSEGERVVTRPDILPYTTKIMFTSIIPQESNDPCQTGGGKSWVLVVDMYDGGSFNGPVFDVNKDDSFDAENDMFTANINGEEVLLPYTSIGIDHITNAPINLIEDAVEEDPNHPGSGSPRMIVPVIAGQDGGTPEELRKISTDDGGGNCGDGCQSWRQLR